MSGVNEDNEDADGPVPVAVIMGSQSAWPTMQHATDVLEELEIGYELPEEKETTNDIPIRRTGLEMGEG